MWAFLQSIVNLIADLIRMRREERKKQELEKLAYDIAKENAQFHAEQAAKARSRGERR